MSAPSVDNISKFIIGCDLAEVKSGQASRSGSASIPSGFDEQGFVNRGSILCFPPCSQQQSGPDKQARDDALLWTLFAQLAADKAYNRVTQLDDWYRKYIWALGQIGMTTQGFSFSAVSAAQQTVALTAIELTANFLTAQQAALATKCINALAGNASEVALSIFNQAALNTNGGNFQVAAVEISRDVTLNISIGYCSFKSNSVVVKSVFEQISASSIAFSQGSDKYSLSKTIADGVRPNLYRRLKNHINNNIDDIPL